jgi:membrane protein DedA with SNARE-associated domain
VRLQASSGTNARMRTEVNCCGKNHYFHGTLQKMWHYVYVFIAAFIVDSVPFFGPPAWTVMVFFQMRYHLNIWWVLIVGVTGSALGRYLLSKYIPYLSAKMIKKQKNEDIEFIGQKLGNNSWRIQLFVLLYTLVPLPSTPLFTAAGMAHIKARHIIPAFFVGKFISDMVMVLTGDYAVKNAKALTEGFLTWKTISGTAIGIILVFVFLFIDWRVLLQQKKFRLNFHIWK